jgi:hypothetical protein
MYLFVISAILFLAGGLLFSNKVSQAALEERFSAAAQEAGEAA